MAQPRIIIISPALANANNGNWQTARRWANMLHREFTTDIAQVWNGEPFDAMIALHARRSAESIARWSVAQGISSASRDSGSYARNLAVVLTGTDLYGDILTDSNAQASLAFAGHLVVLQDKGVLALAPEVRGKARVIFQSTTTRGRIRKTRRHLRAVMVGHLRDVKAPQTLFAVARILKNHPDILIDHVGEPLDAQLGRDAQATSALCPNYRWLGGLSREAARRHIQRAHVLINASRMEGGAHVVMEAVCSGTPVLASKIDGNIGMLGEGYAGYFDVDDAQGLATLLTSCRVSQLESVAAGPDVTSSETLLNTLSSQCDQRAELFSPQRERADVVRLVHDLLAG